MLDSPDPRVLAAFDRLFKAMGVDTPEAQVTIIRAIYQSDAMHKRLRELAVTLVEDARQRKPKEP